MQSLDSKVRANSLTKKLTQLVDEQSATSWTQQQPQSVDEKGRTVVNLREGVDLIKPVEPFEIERIVAERARARLKRGDDDPILPMKATRNGDEQIIGVLREVERRIEISRTRHNWRQSIASLVSGVLANEPIGRITIHASSPIEDVLESYTSWIPSQFVRDRRIRKGLMVSARLVGLKLPNADPVWVCRRFRIVG
jgi:hypothetical protein